jgi:hypothetical protein
MENQRLCFPFLSYYMVIDGKYVHVIGPIYGNFPFIPLLGRPCGRKKFILEMK